MILPGTASTRQSPALQVEEHMEVGLGTAEALSAPADLLAVGVFADLEPGPGAEQALEALGTPLRPLMESRGFSSKTGEAVALPTLGRLPAATLLLLGLGDRSAVDADTLRRATGSLVREARGAKHAVTTLAQAGPGDQAVAVRAVTEAAILAGYRFDKYKASSNGKRPSLERHLSNEPANNLHPEDLAAAAARAVEGKSVAISVKDERDLAAEGFGGIVGVGQGASNPPRLVELRYEPEGARGRVVLVGKGITFDSGGLSLKPPDGMITMKTDMSGAAAVLAVMSALDDLGVRVAVTGYLATAENMPSGTATRPGGALTAGLFLQEFVDGRPWVHLDIAGPARADSDDGYLAKGSTGAAVRTLLSWLDRRGAGD